MDREWKLFTLAVIATAIVVAIGNYFFIDNTWPWFITTYGIPSVLFFEAGKNVERKPVRR